MPANCVTKTLLLAAGNYTGAHNTAVALSNTDSVAVVGPTTPAPMRSSLAATDTATIDGEGSAWLFAVSGTASLRLENVVLARGRGGQFDPGDGTMTSGGGALRVTGSGTVSVAGVLFDANTAAPASDSSYAKGGAVFLSSDGAMLFGNCAFQNNRATGSNAHGGGLYAQASNASVLAVSPVFDLCLFEANRADTNGGGVYMQDVAPRFSNCTWRDNEATVKFSFGGGIDVRGTSTVSASAAVPVFELCLFEANRAGINGGGVHLQDAAARFSNCTWRDNEVTSGSGGGIDVFGSHVSSASSMSPMFKQCLFEANRATRNGGGTFVEHAAARFSNCTWRGNEAMSNRGGGIKIYGSSGDSASATVPVFERCLFESNRADGGGGAYVENAAPRFINCTWRANEAIKTGGGVFVRTTDGVTSLSLTFDCCTFVGNNATGADGGGGLAIRTSEADTPANLAFVAGSCAQYSCVQPAVAATPPPTIEGVFRQWTPHVRLLFTGATSFDGNIAPQAVASGGALAIGLSGSVFFRGVSRFINNHAGLFGGAVFIAAGSATLALTDGGSAWENNSAGSARGDHIYSASGGAIALGAATLRLGGDRARLRAGVSAGRAGNISWGKQSTVTCAAGHTLSATTSISTTTFPGWVLEGCSNGTAGFRNGSNCPGYFDNCVGGLSKSTNPYWAKNGYHDPKAVPVFPPMLATRISVSCIPCGSAEWADGAQAVSGPAIANATTAQPLSSACKPCAGRMSPGIDCEMGALRQRAGWWRPADDAATGFRTQLFPCYTDACIGSVNNAAGVPSYDEQCRTGYMGPVCEVCAPSYVRRSGACVFCPPGQNVRAAINVALVCLATVAALALVYRRRHKLRVEPFKIVLGFYSLLAALGDTFSIRWPIVFTNVLASIKAAFVSVSQLSALACSLHIHHYAVLCFWTFGLIALLATIAAWFFVKLQYSRHSVLRKQLPKVLFYALLFAYPLVCPPVIATFICRTVDGTSYLVADYTLQCHTPAWNLAVVWCCLWVAAYVVGLPVAVVLAVRRRLPTLTYLNDGYRGHPVTRYWEVLEMGRKLLLSSAVLLFEKGTSMQIAVATVCSVVFLVLHTLYEPFVEPADNRLQTLALASLFGIYFLGLLIKVHPDAGQNSQFEALLTVMSLIVAIGSVLNAGVHAATKTKKLLARATKNKRLLAQQMSCSDEGVEMKPISAISNPAYDGGD